MEVWNQTWEPTTDFFFLVVEEGFTKRQLKFIVTCSRGMWCQPQKFLQVWSRVYVSGVVAELKYYCSSIMCCSCAINHSYQCAGLITAYGKSAMYEDATSAFNSMEECHCEPDQGTFNALIEAYAGT